MQLDLMIEGQEGVTWAQWQEIAGACERYGIPTLFRSDHYMNLDGEHPERGSLDALGTLCGLAALTTRLRLGTMVSPATFRHPSLLAKLATTVDLISDGRFELGLGAGWHEREHAAYGFEYYDVPTRVDILAEQLEIVLGSWGPGPFSFEGKHYRLDELDAQPKPEQKPHPPLIMGGSGGPRVAALAARFADEYNTVFTDPEGARAVREKIDAACEAVDRAPIPFSLMTCVIVGTDDLDLQLRAKRSAEFRGIDVNALLSEPPHGWIVGTVDRVAERIREYQRAGVVRIMCQTMPHDDLEAIEIIGHRLTPLVA
jgi:F420-dependent oxidoreductase-like protein